MQEFNEVYKQNAKDITNFVTQTILSLGKLSNISANNYQKLFEAFPSLELVYTCNANDYKQASANVYRNKVDDKAIGKDRLYLIEKIELIDNEIIKTCDPYLSSATGSTCITVIKQEGNTIYFMDFDISVLLERLGFIERHTQFAKITKAFYFSSSIVMMILALFTIGYSAIEFIDSLLFKSGLSIDSVFKPIIALTLGLAVFDLAKTVMENEVFFKSYSKNSNSESKVLTKFSVTIIIALLIESLMVVFKIAIDDYTKMQSAFYLISAVSILIVSLAIFTYLSKKK